jgi:hypothetical protein
MVFIRVPIIMDRLLLRLLVVVLRRGVCVSMSMRMMGLSRIMLLLTLMVKIGRYYRIGLSLVMLLRRASSRR